jgi:hypothetical protein
LQSACSWRRCGIASPVRAPRKDEQLLRDPDDVAAYDESLAKVTIGELQPLNGRIEIRDYDPTWPDLYAREARRRGRIVDDGEVKRVSSEFRPETAANVRHPLRARWWASDCPRRGAV